MKAILFLILSTTPLWLIGQTAPPPRVLGAEFDLTVDNDAFYLVNEEDQYYSSGVFAGLSFLHNPESKLYKAFNKKGKLIRLSHGYHFLHLMYTPFDIKYSNVDILDRPYAGAIALGKSISFFNSNNWKFHTKLDLGILGPATKTEELQTWWHASWDMKEPRGWEHQINNTPYVNITAQIDKSIAIDDWVDLVYESEYEVGTIFNNIQQGGVIRLGNIRPMSYSGYKNGLIGRTFQPNSGKPIEWYFFFGISRELVFYNSTIDGNFIGHESDYTEDSEKWVNRRKSGVNIHWQTFDLGIHFYRNSSETTESDEHKYIRIRLTKRF